MRILVVVPFYKPAYGFGGPTRSVPALAEGLTARGHDVEVATTNASVEGTLDISAGSKRVVDGVPVTYFGQFRVLGRIYFAPNLSRFLRSNVSDFDIVYIYGIWPHPSLAAGAACRKADVPYVVSPRTGLMQWPLRRRRFLKKFHLLLFGRRYLNGAAAIHYTTEKEQVESEQLSFSSEGFVVPNPVDLSEFEEYADSREHPSQGESVGREVPTIAGGGRDSDSGSNDQPTVLFLGRLEPRKGLELALHGFAEVRKEVPGARFVIAGPSYRGYRQELKKTVEELQLADAVHFTGFLDSEQRLVALDRADVFVLTSWTENFAVAAVEAMAMGCPPVLTEDVGVAPAAGNAGSAVVVEREVEDVRQALTRLLTDPRLREEMAARAHDYVRKFAPERVAASLEREFQRVLET